jgi:hypothetical protein
LQQEINHRLAAIFATPILAGSPDTLTSKLALLALANGEVVGICIPWPPVPSIIVIALIIPIVPIVPIVPIIPIRGRFNARSRCSGYGKAPEQADQHKPRSDEMR